MQQTRRNRTRHTAALAVVAVLVASRAMAADVSAAVGQAAGSPDASPDDGFPATLDATGAVIDEVRILPGNIFDLTNPAENRLLYRLANRLHATTRRDVIAHQLLFDAGDDYSSQLLQESERLLRSNRYIKDASVAPTRNDDGSIDVEVRTTDTWTLSPRFSFGRAGGENSLDLGIKEMNLLGRGIGLEALFSSNVDRNTTMFKYVDKHVGNSWYDLQLGLEDNSDGYLHDISVGLPFYALDSRRAGGASYLAGERIDTFYSLGQPVGNYLHETNAYDIFLGWSPGLRDGWVRRYSAGLAYDEHRFAPLPSGRFPETAVPGDRRLFYPYAAVEWLQNDYRETRNVDQINRTEDHYLGTRVSAKLGYASRATGSDRDAWILEGRAQTGFGDIEHRSLFLDGGLATRLEHGAVADLVFDANARYYSRQSGDQLYFAHLGATYGQNLDADHQVYLGGDSGLRGYPLRYQAGDKRVLLTLEKRYFTDWYPFRLFRVGGAVFFDAGRTWGDSPSGAPSRGWLRDVGVGLRLGNARSGLGNMIHIDLAYPLDSDGSIDNVQLLISTRQSF